MRAELDELDTFIAVARHRSFRKAAAQKNLTPSTLSHAMKALEGRLGVRLLNRTTRSVELTEAGAALLARVQPALRELGAALDDVNEFRVSLKGSLRLNVPRPAGRLLLPAILEGFLAEHPEIRVEVTTDDGIIDIVEQGFDAGIRFGEIVPLDMIGMALGAPQRFAVVASPACMARTGEPREPGDLRGRPCIGRRFPSGVLYAWEFHRGDQAVSVRVGGRLALDDDEGMVRAATSGLGFAYVYAAYADELVERGALVSVLQDWCAPSSRFTLYYPSRRHQPATLRAFVDWCVKHERQRQEAPTDHSSTVPISSSE